MGVVSISLDFILRKETASNELAVGFFSGCASLSSFICPGGVKSIGGDSFSCCVTLKFSFEDGSCWAIGSHCFRDCVSLCHFLVPVSVLLAMDASLTVFFLVILYLSARVLSSFARV